VYLTIVRKINFEMYVRHCNVTQFLSLQFQNHSNVVLSVPSIHWILLEYFYLFVSVLRFFFKVFAFCDTLSSLFWKRTLCLSLLGNKWTNEHFLKRFERLFDPFYILHIHNGNSKVVTPRFNGIRWNSKLLNVQKKKKDEFFFSLAFFIFKVENVILKF
jgi:hypothetical protein